MSDGLIPGFVVLPLSTGGSLEVHHSAIVGFDANPSAEWITVRLFAAGEPWGVALRAFQLRYAINMARNQERTAR